MWSVWFVGALLTSGAYGTMSNWWTACNELEDGQQWIQPFSNPESEGLPRPYNHPIPIKVLCSDGWTILDPSILDEKHINDYHFYFSSYFHPTPNTVSTAIDDPVTWVDWFLPADETFEFRVSPDCQSCIEDDSGNDWTAYYMTGNYHGCSWITQGMCDMDMVSSECFECAAPGFSDDYSGACTHMAVAPDLPVVTDHESCAALGLTAMPSLGTNGENCVCYKPRSVEYIWANPKIQKPEGYDDVIVPRSADTLVEVTNDEFLKGTYRITEPGYYKLMEDIVLKINQPTDFDDGYNLQGYWSCHADQDKDYPGCGPESLNSGPFSMGFFAGMSVESDDVTIDLNGFSMRMNHVFQIQQAWFSIIELGSSPYLPGQGPHNFGNTIISPSRVTIKNGMIGTSSHFGIHGNGNKDVTLTDLVVSDFNVAGIVMNGFEHLTIENVEIGECYRHVVTNGEYTLARQALNRLKMIYKENPQGKITLNGRGDLEFNAMHIADELEKQMDMLIGWFYRGEDWPDTDMGRQAELRFANPSGLTNGGSSYGMLLNGQGASGSHVGVGAGYSVGATLKDIYIHGIYTNAIEVPHVSSTRGAFNEIFDIIGASDNGFVSIDEANYIGTAYSNGQLAMHELSADWGMLGYSTFDESVSQWAMSGSLLNPDILEMKCNNDIMGQLNKGAFGMKIEKVLNLNLDGIVIENIQNGAVLGSYICGNYDSSENGGHRLQMYPTQYGYTGTEAHGISLSESRGLITDVQISNVVSARGDSVGIQMLNGNTHLKIQFATISDIHAGAFLEAGELPNMNMPNKVPRACAIDEWLNKQHTRLRHNYASCITAHTLCGVYTEWAKEGIESDLITECTSDNLLTENNVPLGHVYERLSEKTEGHAFMYSILQSQNDETHSSISIPLYMLLFTCVVFLIIIVYKDMYSNKTSFIRQKMCSIYASPSEIQPLKDGPSYGSMA